MTRNNTQRILGILAGLGLGTALGAGVMYLWDPRMGRRRRVRLTEKMIRLTRLAGITGGHRGIDFHETITIAAPVEQVFDFWTNYDTFPQFMRHVKEVRATGEGRSHWILAGPGGTPIEWNAVITKLIPNKVLAWKTEPDSIVQYSGIIHFTGHRDRTTTINIKLSYNPPAGAIGHSLVSLFGSDPKTLMDEDLVRMKSLIETGKQPHDAANISAAR